MLSTSHKIAIARGLATLVVGARRIAGLTARVTATRRGVVWSLDLNEGIDFAIYLLGGFEVRTLRRYESLVRPGDVVFDIGANIGAHTLPLAKLVGPEGRVYAFEPTQFAFGKLKTNLALNPGIAGRVDPCQAMLVAAASAELPAAIYSSWPLDGGEDLHGSHHGRLMGTAGAVTTTLDDFVAASGVPRVDFMKIDVDGAEADVLEGAAATLRKFSPRLVLELAPYVYDANPGRFDELLRMLWDAGYSLSEIAGGRELARDPARVRAAIPEGGGMNVLATRAGISR